MIYADNAATTKMSRAAIQAMLPYLDGVYGNPSSLHSAGQRAQEALSAAREKMAALLGCLPSEITFTSGGSEADNQALVSGAAIGARKGKKHIVSTAFEHHAVLHTLKKLEKEGFEITLVPVDGLGMVSPEAIEAAIRPDTCLVSVMYANNEIGTVQPIPEIAAICKSKGVLFHTDAVQAAGHIPVSLENVDMLSMSAHKFHGPKGAGLLYARRGVKLTNVIEGGAQERGRRAGTENVAAIAGMAAAFEESVHAMQADADKLNRLSDILIAGLSEIPHGILNGDRVKRLPGSVSFCFEGIEGESLLLMLDDMGVCASSGSACTSGSLDPSHVLLAIGRPHEIAHGSLRLTLSAENTEEDAREVVRCVKEVVEKLRGMSPVWRELQNGTRKYFLR